MIINNINVIKKFNLVLTNRDIQALEVVNYTDWLEGALTPIIGEERFNLTSINLSFFIEGGDEREILYKISSLINIFKSGEIFFEDLDIRYEFSLETHRSKIICDKAYELNIILKASCKIKDGITETINRITNKTINVAGNLETPAIVEVTPSIDLIDLTITGLAEDPIILKNLKASKKIIVNGENGTVTVDGVNKYADTDMWGFPKLIPGSNTITVDKSSVDMTIKYKPRYI